jgi:hypothetical protein
MTTWMKFLVIGWSIVCVGIMLFTYPIMKKQYIDEDYEIYLALKEPVKVGKNSYRLSESLFQQDERITKKQMVSRLQDTNIENITITTIQKRFDDRIYIVLPLFTFLVWVIPVTVFSLVGVLFSRRTDNHPD